METAENNADNSFLQSTLSRPAFLPGVDRQPLGKVAGQTAPAFCLPSILLTE
jgi:hypothetical protein